MTTNIFQINTIANVLLSERIIKMRNDSVVFVINNLT